MTDENNTKEELVNELRALRLRIAELKNSETERKKTEEKLLDALKRVEDEKARTGAIIAAIGDGITIQDMDFKILYQNQVFIEMLGNHVGEYCYAAYEGMESTCAGCPVAMSFKDGEIHTVERAVRTDQGMVYFENTASALRDSEGKNIAGIEVVRNITGRKEAEEELADYTRQVALSADVGATLVKSKDLRSLLQLCAEAVVTHIDVAFARIWILNEKDNVLELQASAGIYTHVDGPHSRVPVGKFNIGLIAQEKKPYLTNAVIGDPLISDPEWAKREGMIAFAGYPLVVADEVVGVMAMFSKKYLNESTLKALATIADEIALGIERKKAEKSLTEAYVALKAAQSQILQQEKMSSIGQLAAGIAHEINNPIGYIMSNLGTLMKYNVRIVEYLRAQERALDGLLDGQVSDSAAVRAKLDELKGALKMDYILHDMEGLIGESIDGAERVKKIVQDLKSFSHVDEAELKQADINKGVESTINIVWNELKYKTALKKEYGDIPLTRCNLGQLNQVFLNLLMNAVQAIEKEGEITVKTRADGGFIHVVVSDTGCGIDPDKFSRIFEPFFTTKPVGKGTGLGLSIAYDIVKKHNGEIVVESEAGKGTTFIVKLPVVE